MLTRYNIFLMSTSFMFGCVLAFSMLAIGVLNCETRKSSQHKMTASNDDSSHHYHHEELFMITLVVSAPKNFEQRNAIRDTWANQKTKWVEYNVSAAHELIFIPKHNADGFLENEPVDRQRLLLENYKKWLEERGKQHRTDMSHIRLKHLFVIGTNDLSADLQNNIVEEQINHSDLLLLTDFKDDYRQLSDKLLRSISELVDLYKFKYILKCDDDAYVKLDLLVQELNFYHNQMSRVYDRSTEIDLYWGYFNGRAQQKVHGKWAENNYHLSDRYLPYAVGGGYVISYKIAKFIADHHTILGNYVSEDVSMGVWTAPFKNIHRKHDVRFDTQWLARNCRNYHLVLHKRTPKDMYDIYNEKTCSIDPRDPMRRPVEYFYNWSAKPSECCGNAV